MNLNGSTFNRPPTPRARARRHTESAAYETEHRDAIPKDKVPAFVKLLEATATRLGSMTAVGDRFGFSTAGWTRWKDGTRTMTPEVARRILNAHKVVKAEKQ